MTNNKQQTAVEQFAIVLYQKFKLEGNGKELNDLVEQAKEMEKQKMINFARKYMLYIHKEGIITIETFYNETYGGNK